jgi:predicted dehydrogenase
MNPIKTAILSYGMSGKVFHAPLLKAHPGFRLSKIVQRNGSDAASDHPDAEVVNSVKKIFHDPEIELVVVNATNDTHFEFAKKALKSGKHVIVEKPFTNTVAEGKKLIDLADIAGKLLSVFQNRRWDSDFLTVKKIIGEGSIGRIVEYESNFDRYRNYIQPNTWKENPGPGSGLLYNLGPHLIDQAIVLFGKPESVFADIRKIRNNSQVDDYFEIVLFYPDVKVRLHSSYLVKKPNPRFILHGTTGSFVKYGLDPQEEQLKKGMTPDHPGYGEENVEIWGLLDAESGGNTVEQKIKSARGNYLAYYDTIYKSLRENQPPEVTAEQALWNIHAIELAYRSTTSKKAIRFKL